MCTPNWQCSACVNGQQTRSCSDINNCGVTCTDNSICGTTQSCVVTKKFNCRNEYPTGYGSCGGGRPDCAVGYINIYCAKDSCRIFWNKYNCLCRKDYWTDCLENPSCGSDTYLSEQTC
ncbi:MAG: hypothetical protein NT139_01850 [Candidatus Woesearchaeota archaeon]|nr:hypothetical protein [Candidatus Woesearchaeota archaeon]